MSDEHAETLVAGLAQQQDVLALEHELLHRLLREEPATSVLQFGSGMPSEQTIGGDQRAGWNGLAILNPTALTIFGGDGPGGALLPRLVVPPFSWVCMPLRFVNYSLGVQGADLLAPMQNVTFVSLRNPPAGVSAGPLGGAPIADSQTKIGSAANPGVFTFLVQLPLPAGIYDVELMTAQAGTFDNKPMNIDFYLGLGQTWVSSIPSLPTPSKTRLRRLTVDAAHGAISCYVSTAGGAGSLYVAQTTAVRVA